MTVTWNRVMRNLLTSILLSSLLSVPWAAMAAENGVATLLSTVRLERPLYFPTPAGDPILLPPGEYVVEAHGLRELQVSAKDRIPLVVSAVPDKHEEELERPFALSVPDDSAPSMTHLLLLLPDGRTLQSTGSVDGVMSRLVPPHIVVAVLKALVTGSPVKNVMQMETNTNRPGKSYRTSTLFVGMCALLCERDEDCRAFTWKRNVTKPIKGSCHLMEGAPTKQTDGCCVSGAKPVGVAK